MVVLVLLGHQGRFSLVENSVLGRLPMCSILCWCCPLKGPEGVSLYTACPTSPCETTFDLGSGGCVRGVVRFEDGKCV